MWIRGKVAKIHLVSRLPKVAKQVSGSEGDGAFCNEESAGFDLLFGKCMFFTSRFLWKNTSIAYGSRILSYFSRLPSTVTPSDLCRSAGVSLFFFFFNFSDFLSDIFFVSLSASHSHPHIHFSPH